MRETEGRKERKESQTTKREMKEREGNERWMLECAYRTRHEGGMSGSGVRDKYERGRLREIEREKREMR